jgi:GTPase
MSPQALSAFADYVEKQQAKRHHPGRNESVAPSDSGYSTQSTITEDHAELDIIDSLGLSDVSSQVRLKDLLLDTSEEAEVTLQQLGNLLQSRLLEGHGETLFDLGQEDNGESMVFSKEQWDVALDRIRRAASALNADCQILLTRNVGGPEEAESKNEKEKGASGKIMIRQNPVTVEDVIETRIAVVGNGTL